MEEARQPPPLTGESVLEWAKEVHSVHAKLRHGIEGIVSHELTDNSLNVVSITSRTKDVFSIVEKVERKTSADPRYRYPTDMTDVTGIRIVVLLESNVQEVRERLDRIIKVDLPRGGDKNVQMDADRVGYRSYHIVGELADEHLSSDEARHFAGIKIEIQIRTRLEHSWSEVAHDRLYKLSSRLSKEMVRKMNLHAGILEVVDKALD